jgi:RecA/RadA recombinase
MAKEKKVKAVVEQNDTGEACLASVNRAKNFLKKYNKNVYASVLSESRISNVTDWISSGSYSFNRVLSGSYLKGFANNRLYVIAGPSSTGKSLICARACKEAQDKGYTIVYFDSENAIDDDFMKRFGVRTDELIYVPVKTISEFRNAAVQMMKDWRADEDTKDAPVFFFCDSLGGMMGTKEMNDVEQDKSASDMGQRAKELRACARVLTIECAQHSIPMICTNHTYEQAAANPQAAPQTKMTGGEGFMYASSAVIYLRKRQVKEDGKNALGDTVKTKTGNIIIATAEKNRFVPEGTKSEIYCDFEKGIQKWYGLLEDAVTHGFIEKRATRLYVKHLDKSFFETQIFTTAVFGPIFEELNKKVEESLKFNITIDDTEEAPEVDAAVEK